MPLTGEVLEKATRALTEEEKKVMETEWVGKTGEKRKLEVRILSGASIGSLRDYFADDYGASKAQKVLPIRSEMAWTRSQMERVDSSRTAH